MKILLPDRVFKILRVMVSSFCVAWLLKLAGIQPFTTSQQFIVNVIVYVFSLVGIANLIKFLDYFYMRHFFQGKASFKWHSLKNSEACSFLLASLTIKSTGRAMRTGYSYL